MPDMPSMAAWCTFVTRAKLPAGHAVDVVEALDHVQLPERAVEVERAGHEAGHLDAQLAPVTGRRQGDVADVELEVEVGILDPVRVVEVERDAHEPLAEDAGLVQPLLDVVEDPLERHPPARRRRRVVDRRRRHRPCGREASPHRGTTRPSR